MEPLPHPVDRGIASLPSEEGDRVMVGTTSSVNHPVGRISNSDWFVNSFIIFFSSVRIWCPKDD